MRDFSMLYFSFLLGSNCRAFPEHRCNSFRTDNSMQIRTEICHARRFLFNTDGGRKDEEEKEEEEQEDEALSPYGHRSLAWTKWYRNAIPYEKARRRAMDLGLSTKEEWDDLLIKAGKIYHESYLISRPEEMYQEDWVSWEVFLGAMRTFEETRDIVQNVLHLSNMEEYVAFISHDPKRAEGLRIPAKPDVFYKSNGWEGPEHFFGNFV